MLQDKIASADFFSFADYMELALFHPQYGYYSASLEVFGQEGDFITAPELTPYFAYVLAVYFLPALKHTPAILELGPGTGRFAKDCMTFLASQGVDHLTYFLYEKSPVLRKKQHDLLANTHFDVVWLDELPEVFSGVVFANEFFDSLPVHIVRWDEEGSIYEKGVGMNNDGLCWVERSINEGPLYEKAKTLPVLPPYCSEIHWQAEELMKKIAQTLHKGTIVIIDYGYAEEEYYNAEHDRGTLLCHAQHRAYEDPFFAPGEADLTAHVNFTALARAGIESGLQTKRFETLGRFLAAEGLLHFLQDDGLDHVHKAKYLLDPRFMGERFKILTMDTPSL